MIVSMGKSAAELYGKDPDKVTADGLRVDMILEDADIINLGDEKIAAFGTKGHTDCSVSYFMQPEAFFLPVNHRNNRNRWKSKTSILKSFDQSLESAAFLKMLPFDHILVPHFGILDRRYNDSYFDEYIRAAEEEKDFINDLIKKGMTCEEIFEEHKKVYWTEARKKDQPYRAYDVNTHIIIIKRMLKEAGL